MSNKSIVIPTELAAKLEATMTENNKVIDDFAKNTVQLADKTAKVHGLATKMAETMVSVMPASIIIKAKSLKANGNKDCERSKYYETEEGFPLKLFRDAYYDGVKALIPEKAKDDRRKRIENTMNVMFSRALATAETKAIAVQWKAEQLEQLEAEQEKASEAIATAATKEERQTAVKAATLIQAKADAIEKDAEKEYKKASKSKAKVKTAASELNRMKEFVRNAISVGREFEGDSKKIQALREALSSALESVK